MHQGLQELQNFEMRTHLTSRLLAVALILSVGLFAMQAAGHWHGHESDEQHCQVCHVGHVAVPQPVAHMKLLAPVPVARFAAADQKTILGRNASDSPNSPRPSGSALIP